MKHPVVWHTARPLWDVAVQDATTLRFRRPELLRFAGDDFMERLQGVLTQDPSSLQDFVARPETWRSEDAGWVAQNGAEPVVKLYQPAHQRFYLVGASLVCQVHGLPDKTPLTDEDETVSFVVRRLVNGDEYGWFGDAGWKPVNTKSGLDHEGAAGNLEKEERLPLFAMPISLNGNGTRRLLAGFIPAANREKYEASPRAGAPAPKPPDDDDLANNRFTVFETTVGQALNGLSNSILESIEQVEIAAARDVLLFALLDLAEFLEIHLTEVWDSVLEGAWTGKEPAQQTVFGVLNDGTKLLLGQRWRQALKLYTTGENRTRLLNGETNAVLPVGPSGVEEKDLGSIRSSIVALGTKEGGALYESVKAAAKKLPPLDPGNVRGTPPAVGAGAGGTYVIRCAYERPKCEKHGVPPLVSNPSRPFQLASYFDPDAPVRPLRVTLPVDTSVSGFRGSAKGVSFLFSKQLRDQMDRLKNVKFEDLDSGEIDDSPGLSIGMICSFSIPIITICALILLMIIVQLLNIVFWWLPFFRICFPIPVIENE